MYQVPVKFTISLGKSWKKQRVIDETFFSLVPTFLPHFYINKNQPCDMSLMFFFTCIVPAFRLANILRLNGITVSVKATLEVIRSQKMYQFRMPSTKTVREKRQFVDLMNVAPSFIRIGPICNSKYDFGANKSRHWTHFIGVPIKYIRENLTRIVLQF